MRMDHTVRLARLGSLAINLGIVNISFVQFLSRELEASCGACLDLGAVKTSSSSSSSFSLE